MNTRTVQLGGVAAVFNGKTPSKAEQRRVGHPVLKIRDVDDVGCFVGRFESFVDQDLADSLSDKRVKEGDTLILNAAHNAEYVGSKSFFARGSAVGALATGEWLLIRPAAEQASPSFIHFWSQHAATRKRLSDLVKGIHLYPKDVAEVPIALPDLVEQQRIAERLEQADRLRCTRRYALELSDSFLPAAFLELFGDTASLWQRWPRKPFGEMLRADLRNGLSPSKSGAVVAKVLTLAAITGGDFNSKALKVAPFAYEPPQDKRVSTEDFLVCRGNGNLNLVGRGKFPRHDMPGVVFPDTMIAARVRQNLVTRPFLQAVWEAPFVRAQLEASARTTNGTYKINQEGLSELELPLPPLPVQEEFANLVARHERLRAVQREALRQAEHLFQSLLHRAFVCGL